MKKYFVILFVLLPFFLKAQIITTIAGGGAGGDGGPATSASINNPGYLVFDLMGNLYFTESAGHKVRKVDPSGTISTVAGTGTLGFSGDGGLATAAKLNQPAGITVDTLGNIFFVDAVNNRIRKVENTTGIISTVVGNSTAGYGGDGGIASAATLNLPDGIWFDKTGNLFISDAGNLRLRKVSSSGIITTVAGNGLPGWGGNGTMATATRCYPYSAIYKDNSDNIYFTEWTWGVVRKISTTGFITTITGDTSSHLFNGDGILAVNARLDPFSIVIDNTGVIYISDTYNNRIRKIGIDGIIKTIAGNGIASSTGDNGLAALATIHSPSGITFDSCGNLYFCQANTPRIRKIALNPECWPVAVNDVSKGNANVSIYPNPATESLTITATEKIKSVSVVNAVGQVVIAAEGRGSKQEIDVRMLPAGVYFVRVNEVWVGRFLKE